MRRCVKNTTVAGAESGNDRHGLTEESANAGMGVGDACSMAGICNEKLAFEIVGGVQNKRVVRQDVWGVISGQSHGIFPDAHVIV